MVQTVVPVSVPLQRQQALQQAAQQLEATFLAEMLESAGLGPARGGFGGGAGEAQFASFLVQAQAEAMAEAGGIGLAETLFNALAERDRGG
ncbi:flagellar biosynthesis protein FlgJ [Pseudooceanicola lipolyticus]|uniref:Flagellar biosynthesis protein FlgJ n=1 Tax=Pseudooceanicola lipolyticus TaxID=2029104 RepID=A0A2M8J3H4_9RHOB|nr:rod-binding protein [Pseudooceanicola lipolyticus]PJE37308.1 flagellar biosynthesis protein FlgJ [Pseudooceanicola lipolyticus]